MKTIRLLYPDFVSGNLDEYYLGARLMAQIVPENQNQPLFKIDLPAPGTIHPEEKDGIYALDKVLLGIQKAKSILYGENPDKVITIGGNCLVSLAPFDYLHGLYPDLGIIWIDAHPDVSTPKDGYPNAHAMVLGSLLGGGDVQLRKEMKHPIFKPENLLYVGLQDLHDYQEQFLKDLKVNFLIQKDKSLSDGDITAFCNRFNRVLVHLDIDVLNSAEFPATYFANPMLVGDGSSGGNMSLARLNQILHLIDGNSEIMGLTIAEYLPFAEYKLHNSLSSLRIFS